MSRYDRFDNGTGQRQRSSTERAATMTLLFMDGGEYTTAEVASMLGYESFQGAYRLLTDMSRVIPLVKDDERNGRWYLLK